ncbi:MAG: hypothetical protein COA86_15185 [Kangiella sp.]|nr:MAG: hypothetical protein COA86_15185 [Kangiella sp.]
MSSDSNLQALLLSLGKILSLLISFIVPIFLVRVLTKSDYGLYNQFNMIFLFLSMVFSFGIRSNLLYFYKVLPKEKVRIALFQTVIALLCFSIIAALISINDVVNVYIVGQNELRGYINLIVLAVILQMFSNLAETLYIVRKDMLVSMFYPALSVILKAVIVLSMVIAFQTLEAAIIAILITLLILFLITLLYVLFELKALPGKMLVDFKLFQDQLYYCLPFGISTAIREVSNKFDKLISISFLSTANYASLAVASTPIPGVMAIYDSLVQVYLMEMVEPYKKKEFSKVISIYQNLVSKSTSFTIPLCVLFVFFADFLIPLLFTEAYKDAVDLFRVYIVSFLFTVLASDVVLRSSGETKLILRGNSYALILSIPFTYYSIVHFGALGAVLGAVFSVISSTIFLLYYNIKLLDTRISDFFPWKNIATITGITCLAFIPLYIHSHYFDVTLFSFLYCSCVFGAIIVVLEYRFDLLFIERELIDKYLKKLNISVRFQ